MPKKGKHREYAPGYAEHLRNLAAVDSAVRSGQFPNGETLARSLKVCSRTVHRYFAFLRQELGAPLVYVEKRKGFRYKKPWDLGAALLRWMEIEAT